MLEHVSQRYCAGIQGFGQMWPWAAYRGELELDDL